MGNAKAHVLLATGPDEATAAVVNDASSSYATALRAHSLDEALRLYESGTLAFAIVDAEVGWADRLLERCYAPGQDAVVPILLLCDAEFLARYGPSFPLPQGADCLHKPVHPALLDLKIRNMLATYRQQQVLKDQHDQWETALAAADLASWEWDVVQDRITWSSQLAARQGVRVEDAPQTIADFLKIVHPDDVGRVKQTIEGALVRGDRYACEMRILNSDGSIRHVLATGHVRCDRTGRPVRLIGIERDVTAERDVEQALRASEQRFRAVQQSTPDGFMIFRSLRDPSGQIVDFIWEFVNPAAEKIVQRTEVSLLGKRLLEEMPGNREEGLFDAFVQVVETGRSWQREFHYQHEAVDAWFRSTASKAGDGFAVSFADITAFRRGQTALHESEERLRLALQAGSTGVWEWDLASNRVVWSAETYAIFDIPPDQFAGTRDAFMERVHPDDLAMLHETLAGVIASGMTYSGAFRILRGIGRVVRHVKNLGIVRRNTEGKAVSIVGTVTDVTDALAAEAALRQRERELRSLADNSPSIIARFDREFRHVFVNKSVEAATGMRVEQFIGRTNRELGMPPSLCQKWEAAMLHVLATGEPQRMTFEFDGPHGKRWFESQIVAERDGSGEPDYLLAVTRDVTVEHEALDQLAAAKEAAESASAAKDRFIAVLSHELRTPLSPVRMAVSHWEQQPGLSHELREDLKLIRRNIELEIRLIDDLLDVNAIANGKLQWRPEAVDLHQVAQHAIETVQGDAKQGGLRIVHQAKASRSIVQGDAARLQQIVWNLLRNAIKFTPRGGTIKLLTHSDDANIILQVHDTGRGIERSMLDRIFDAFDQGRDGTSLQFGGLGLGLSICRNLARLHHGTLNAHSDGIGTGATFTLALPARCRTELEAAAEPAAPASAAGASRRRARVLIVEDHPDTSAMMKKLLTFKGFDVTCANGVEQGRAAWAKEEFDLLISDIGLPDGTGHDLVRSLAAHRPLKAIALTGYGMDEDVQRSVEAGFARQLTKPVDFNALLHAVHDILNPGADKDATPT